MRPPLTGGLPLLASKQLLSQVRNLSLCADTRITVSNIELNESEHNDSGSGRTRRCWKLLGKCQIDDAATTNQPDAADLLQLTDATYCFGDARQDRATCASCKQERSDVAPLHATACLEGARDAPRDPAATDRDSRIPEMRCGESWGTFSGRKVARRHTI